MSGPLHEFDKPNSYIGRSIARPDARRLVEGQGHYVDDLQLPRMTHAAFVRSPYAHAQITGIDTNQAKALSGVIAVFSAEEINAGIAHSHCRCTITSNRRGCL